MVDDARTVRVPHSVLKWNEVAPVNSQLNRRDPAKGLHMGSCGLVIHGFGSRRLSLLLVGLAVLGACGPSGPEGASSTGTRGSAPSEYETIPTTLGASVTELTSSPLESSEVAEMIAPATAAFEQLVDRSEATEFDFCPAISWEELATSAPSGVELSAVELIQTRISISSSYPPFDEVSCYFRTNRGHVRWGVLRSIEDAQTQVFCLGQQSGNMTGYAGVGPMFTFYLDGGFQCGIDREESAGVMGEVGEGLVFVLTPSFGGNDRASADILIAWMHSLGRDALRRLAGVDGQSTQSPGSTTAGSVGEVSQPGIIDSAMVDVASARLLNLASEAQFGDSNDVSLRGRCLLFDNSSEVIATLFSKISEVTGSDLTSVDTYLGTSDYVGRISCTSPVSSVASLGLYSVTGDYLLEVCDASNLGVTHVVPLDYGAKIEFCLESVQVALQLQYQESAERLLPAFEAAVPAMLELVANLPATVWAELERE